MNFKRRRRRRGGIKGCCGMCMLRKTNGLRNGRKLTLPEKAIAMSMREQMQHVSEWGWIDELAYDCEAGA